MRASRFSTAALVSSLTLLLGVSLTACGGESPRTDAALALTGDAINGDTLFEAHCVDCHHNGKLGAPDFRDGVEEEHTDREAMNAILSGLFFRMPGFEADLTDQEAADLLASVRAQEASAVQ